LIGEELAAEHISDHDLERYYLGMVTDERELAAIEEHLLWCTSCVDRAEESERFVEATRIASMRLADQGDDTPEKAQGNGVVELIRF
jgi:hypothetical protein